jgi:IS5 family transposase
MATMEELRQMIMTLSDKLDRYHRDNYTQRIELAKELTELKTKQKIMWGAIILLAMGSGGLATAFRIVG